MLAHKEAIVSHLHLASLFLGSKPWEFMLIVMSCFAFSTPETQIFMEPIFAQLIQSAHGKNSPFFL